MTSIICIAQLTFLELIRNRILYGALGFGGVMLLIATLLASVTMGRTELMIHDIGLALISLIGNLMAMVFVIQGLQQDHENRILYVLLSRTPSRAQYIFGKFAGIGLALSGLVTLMYLMLAALVAIHGPIHWLSSVQACAGTIMETWMVTGIALIFAQTSSLFLAVLLTLAMDAAGRSTDIIHHLSQHAHSEILRFAGKTMYYMIPDLNAVNFRDAAGYVPAVPPDVFVRAVGYGLAETGMLLVVAAWIFDRRNLG